MRYREGMETAALQRDGQRDFDFLFGTWNVRNRRLRHPLSGSGEWYEFDSTCTARPVWGGTANVDEFIGDTPLGKLEGMTLRLYDKQTARWSLYWANSTNGLTVVPNVGAFDDAGVGDFFSNEVFEGKPIICRYRWTQKYGRGCRWEQAFSADDGATWETNWIMEFTPR